MFNTVYLLSCYFTHHIFWIGSPKRKACDNHSWLCHVQSCVVWSPFCLGLVVGQFFETKSKDSRIDPLSVLTFKLFNLFSWFQDWCLFTLFSSLVVSIKFYIWVLFYYIFGSQILLRTSFHLPFVLADFRDLVVLVWWWWDRFGFWVVCFSGFCSALFLLF